MTTGELHAYKKRDIVYTVAHMSTDTDTFAGTIAVRGTSNQIKLGTTNTTTVTATAPSTSRTYTLIDAGANAEVVLTEGTQTINGTKTYSGDISTDANIAIPLPVSGNGSTGVITAGGSSFIHNRYSGGDNNLFIGVEAGNFTITGGNNLVVGSKNSTLAGAGAAMTTASSCTLLGPTAGRQLTTGSNNIFVGANAGGNVTTGTNNVIIGTVAGSSTLDRTISIGSTATATNGIRIGNSANQTSCTIAGISGSTSAGGVAVLVNATGVLGTVLSSARFKKDIVDLPANLSDRLLSIPLKQYTYIKDETNEIQYGAIAETVLPIWPETISYDIDGTTPNTIQYHKWVPVLAQIAQQHNAQLTGLKSTPQVTLSLQATTEKTAEFVDLPGGTFILGGNGNTTLVTNVETIHSATDVGALRILCVTTNTVFAAYSFDRAEEEGIYTWKVLTEVGKTSQIYKLQGWCSARATVSFLRIA